MILSLVDTEKGKLVLTGVERGNINNLLSGKPLLINLNEVGIPNVEVFVFFGETQKDIFKQLGVNPFEKEIKIGRGIKDSKIFFDKMEKDL